MTFRGCFSSFCVLLTLAMLTWHQVNVFGQVAYPGNTPGISQPGTPGASHPQNRQQQPVPGFPTGGFANTVPGTGTTATGAPTTGPATAGTPPQNYMIDRPLGVMSNGTQPGNPPQGTTGRIIAPPPTGYNPGKEELDYIAKFLAAWHEKSKEIEALDYDFTCREYSSFGESETYGRVKFRAPDKGLIEIDSELLNGKRSYETNKKMKFICTGEAVYEFNFAEKKLTEFIIPAEDRGKGVMDSPLMILVGANPRELQDRFYLLVLGTPPSMPNCIHLQAWPKWVEDAKEFKCVNVAIDRQTFHAKALLVYDANGEGRKGYDITNIRNKKFLEKVLPDQINLFSKDEFDRNNIVGSRPKGWDYDTKTDFLPEASNPQFARQPSLDVRATPAPVSPQYGTLPNAPISQGSQGPVTQGPLGNYPAPVPAMQQPQGSTQGPANYSGTPQPQFNTSPNNVSPGTNPNNATQRQNNSYMAMPPQNNGTSQTIIR